MSYEIIEHTADIGLRIRGDDLEDLFTSAGRGLFDLITDVEALAEGSTREECSLELKGEDTKDLLLRWLRELLFAFSTKRLVFDRFKFQTLNEKELKAAASGIKFDPDRHEQRHEVKAVTYHGLKVEKTQDGWLAEIIFDI